MHLLDTNFLLAVFYKQHPYHKKAAQFYRNVAVHGWATCPQTENGFLRVGMRQDLQDGTQNSTTLTTALKAWKLNSNHTFWADDLSLTDDLIINIPDHRSVTELYLLALAVKNGGKLVTFDQRIQPELVRSGASALITIS